MRVTLYHTCNLHLVSVQVNDVSVNTVTSTSMTTVTGTWTSPNANMYSTSDITGT